MLSFLEFWPTLFLKCIFVLNNWNEKIKEIKLLIEFLYFLTTNLQLAIIKKLCTIKMFNKIKYKKINDNCINNKEIKENKNKTAL